MEERLKMLQEAAQSQDSQQVKQIAAEQEKLLRENLKLKQQNEELAAKIGQEKVVVKEPQPEELQEFYLKQNAEIETLIRQIMEVQFLEKKEPGKQDILSPALIAKKPETLESLLRFLIYIVLHQEKASQTDPQKVSESAKKTLLELLKSDEEL